jgi:hypothetical protein
MKVFQRRNEALGVDSFRIGPEVISSVHLPQHQGAFPSRVGIWCVEQERKGKERGTGKLFYG